VLVVLMAGTVDMTAHGAQVWIEQQRNLLLVDGHTKIWQGRCAEVRGELTTEQAEQRDTSRKRAITMLTLLRQKGAVYYR
jgi:hypothetical protein